MKLGDKVVCIDSLKDHPQAYPTELIAGQEYTVEGIHDCGKTKSIDVGIKLPKDIGHLYFKCCHHITPNSRYYWAWRFIKLDPDLVEQEEKDRKKLQHRLLYTANSLRSIKAPTHYSGIISHETNR